MNVHEESADVVVIGGRLGGCSASIPLARAGRRVVVLDKMAFPSDQLSTHFLMPAGVSEIAKMGALAGLLAHCNPTLVRELRVEVDGVSCHERVRPADDGIDFGMCVPRMLQDVCLVTSAREQGVDVRERSTFVALHWRGGRVSGVRYADADGVEHDIQAPLVIGADGRRSTVAAAVGASHPYRASRNGRGLVFRYVADPQFGTGTGEEALNLQWREGDSFVMVFPSAPRGTLLVLFMGAAEEVADARADPEGYWQRKLDQHPGVRRRLAGVDPSTYTKLRSTADTSAFFRASSGPGWALVGDASHFKDPVTGQGMRDAMWMGRTLAEHILPHLDDPVATDRATRRWEAHRDEHCLPAYHFANLDTRVEIQSPTLRELIRDAGRSTDPDITDLFGRSRTLQEIAPLPRLGRAAVMALIRGDRSRRETLVRAVPDVRTELEIRRERLRGGFRETRPVFGSDHPDPVIPPAPRVTELYRGDGAAAPPEPSMPVMEMEVSR